MNRLGREGPPRVSGLHLALTVRLRDNLLVAAGDLDAATAPRLGGILRRLESLNRPVTIDLRHLRFADGGGWRVIEEAVRRRDSTGLAPLVLVNVPPRVERLLGVLRQLDGDASPAVGTDVTGTAPAATTESVV